MAQLIVAIFKNNSLWHRVVFYLEDSPWPVHVYDSRLIEKLLKEQYPVFYDEMYKDNSEFTFEVTGRIKI